MAIKSVPRETVLDVLERFFQGEPTVQDILSLSRADIENLRGSIVEFSQADEPVDPPTNAVYPGSWLGGNWFSEHARSDLNQLLLYNPVLVTHDPLSDFFCMEERWLPSLDPIRYIDGSELRSGPAMWNQPLAYEPVADDLEEVKRRIASIVPYMFDLGPLLRAGVIIPRPQWKLWKDRGRREALKASVRHDVNDTSLVSKVGQLGQLPMWDNLKGLDIEITNRRIRPADRRRQHQYKFLELAKQIGFGKRFGAIYVPQQSDELELLRLKLGSVSQQQATYPNQNILRELARIVLPGLKLPPEVAVRIRQNESAFEDWRLAIREIDRSGKNDDPLTLSQRIQDTLQPAKDEIERTVSGSATLQRWTAGGLKAVVTGGLVGGVAHLVGTNVGESLLSAGASGIAGWLFDMFEKPQISGRAQVLTSLQKITDGNV